VKTKSLESSKRKHKSSEAVSDVELQAASSLAQLGEKKIKTTVKKVIVAEVRCVPSAFDDDMIIKPSRKCFFSCLWHDLRFDFRSHSTQALRMNSSMLNLFQMMLLKFRRRL
jgi:hypothetical protein